MTVARERLANRRNHWLYRFQSGDQHFTGGIGRFPDGRIAEIFINGSKVGSAAESNAQDAAIIVRDPSFIAFVMAAIYFKTARGFIVMGGCEQGFLGRVARLAYVGSLN